MKMLTLFASEFLGIKSIWQNSYHGNMTQTIFIKVFNVTVLELKDQSLKTNLKKL